MLFIHGSSIILLIFIGQSSILHNSQINSLILHEPHQNHNFSYWPLIVLIIHQYSNPNQHLVQPQNPQKMLSKSRLKTTHAPPLTRPSQTCISFSLHFTHSCTRRCFIIPISFLLSLIFNLLTSRNALFLLLMLMLFSCSFSRLLARSRSMTSLISMRAKRRNLNREMRCECEGKMCSGMGMQRASERHDEWRCACGNYYY
jgi:hypothetical protein